MKQRVFRLRNTIEWIVSMALPIGVHCKFSKFEINCENYEKFSLTFNKISLPHLMVPYNGSHLVVPDFMVPVNLLIIRV